MTNYEILISQKAFSDIRECVLFVNNVSSEAAKNLYEEIMNAVRSLPSLPNAYPAIEGLSIGDSKVRKMPIHGGRYLVFYKVESNKVVIYDIVDSRKEPSILKV